MKKIDFNQSKQLMQLITVLLQLGVVDLQIFASVSVDVVDITILDTDDYLQMILQLYGNTEK